MSIDAIKHELAGLEDMDRRRIMPYLVAIDDEKDVEYRAEMAWKIADKNPDNWLTFEEFERTIVSRPTR